MRAQASATLDASSRSCKANCGNACSSARNWPHAADASPARAFALATSPAISRLRLQTDVLRCAISAHEAS